MQLTVVGWAKDQVVENQCQQAMHLGLHTLFHDQHRRNQLQQQVSQRTFNSCHTYVTELVDRLTACAVCC